MDIKDMTNAQILHNIYELCKTEDGCRLVKDTMTAAKISYGVHQMLDYLYTELQVFKRPLDYDEIQNICNIMLYACCQASYKEIMAFIDSVPDTTLDTVDDTVGSC